VNSQTALVVGGGGRGNVLGDMMEFQIDQTDYTISRPLLSTPDLDGLTNHTTSSLMIPGFGQGILVTGGLLSENQQSMSSSRMVSILDPTYRKTRTKLLGDKLPVLSGHSNFSLDVPWETFMLGGCANGAPNTRLWALSVFAYSSPLVKTSPSSFACL
jgi:hypothetical protein